MNDRIRELAEQANEAFYQRMSKGAVRGTFYLDGFAEKFAELIIKECLSLNKQVCKELKDEPLDIAGFKTMMNLYNVSFSNKLEEHFGVE